MRTLIVIPARYASNRFPGKPLATLAGKPIIHRVWDIASFVCQQIENCSAIVATETPTKSCLSGRIVNYCQERQIPVTLTSESCRSGSDRVWEVASRSEIQPDIIVNLQGDVPTCPPNFVIKLIRTLQSTPEADVASVYTQLSWESLDALRDAKKSSPFSGATVVTNTSEDALWFSKNIIPAIRNEEKCRSNSSISPVKRHIGLYAYRYKALQFFANAPISVYESLEQLEQLRFIENGYRIRMVNVVYPHGFERCTSGIDSPEDLKRVEQIIKEVGELSFHV